MTLFLKVYPSSPGTKYFGKAHVTTSEPTEDDSLGNVLGDTNPLSSENKNTWNIHSSKMLRSEDGQLVNKVSGDPLGSNFKRCAETSVNNSLRSVTSQKSEDHIYAAAGVWNRARKQINWLSDFQKLFDKTIP
jgi:hypothetical protein